MLLWYWPDFHPKTYQTKTQPNAATPNDFSPFEPAKDQALIPVLVDLPQWEILLLIYERNPSSQKTSIHMNKHLIIRTGTNHIFQKRLPPPWCSFDFSGVTNTTTSSSFEIYSVTKEKKKNNDMAVEAKERAGARKIRSVSRTHKMMIHREEFKYAELSNTALIIPTLYSLSWFAKSRVGKEDDIKRKDADQNIGISLKNRLFSPAFMQHTIKDTTWAIFSVQYVVNDVPYRGKSAGSGWAYCRQNKSSLN